MAASSATAGGVVILEGVTQTHSIPWSVKVNAVELLRNELPRLAHEVISVGDWQRPAEDRYQLSHGMLEVVRELGFPFLIVERRRSSHVLQPVCYYAAYCVSLSENCDQRRLSLLTEEGGDGLCREVSRRS